jgi:hypothetical protein
VEARGELAVEVARHPLAVAVGGAEDDPREDAAARVERRGHARARAHRAQAGGRAGDQVRDLLEVPVARRLALDAKLEVRAVERRHEEEALVEAELARDVRARARVGRRGQREHRDGAALAEEAELRVRGPEVVAILGDAVHLVRDKEREAALGVEGAERVAHRLDALDLLGRDEEHAERVVRAPRVGENRLELRALRLGRSLVEGGEPARAHAEAGELADLRVDEREERRDDDGEPAARAREDRDLEGPRLSTSGWHQAKDVAPGHDRVDDLQLDLAEAGAAEDAAVDGRDGAAPGEVGAPPGGVGRRVDELRAHRRLERGVGVPDLAAVEVEGGLLARAPRAGRGGGGGGVGGRGGRRRLAGGAFEAPAARIRGRVGAESAIRGARVPQVGEHSADGLCCDQRRARRRGSRGRRRKVDWWPGCSLPVVRDVSDGVILAMGRRHIDLRACALVRAGSDLQRGASACQREKSR